MIDVKDEKGDIYNYFDLIDQAKTKKEREGYIDEALLSEPNNLQLLLMKNEKNRKKQAEYLAGLENIVSSGSQILLKDKDGTTIFSHTSKKSFQSVVLSMSNLILGEKFTIIAGNESFTFTISSKATILGNTSSSHPGRPGPR